MRAESFALLVVAAAGCAGDDMDEIVLCSNCEDPPYPRQVLISNAVPDDDVSGLTLVYGRHPDVNGGETVTGVRAAAVPRTGAQFRIVLDELIDGRTVDEFACAGIGYTRDPETCGDCRDDPVTAADETGRCIDRNQDRVPDVVRLLGGMATIRCPGQLIYVTIPGDGYYYPSGNQTTTVGFGLGGLGPALVIEPQLTLPANAACTFDVNEGVLDKQGDALIWPRGGVPFHTAAE